jgi:hypothetical protein
MEYSIDLFPERSTLLLFTNDTTQVVQCHDHLLRWMQELLVCTVIFRRQFAAIHSIEIMRFV